MLTLTPRLPIMPNLLLMVIVKEDLVLELQTGVTLLQVGLDIMELILLLHVVIVMILVTSLESKIQLFQSVLQQTKQIRQRLRHLKFQDGEVLIIHLEIFGQTQMEQLFKELRQMKSVVCILPQTRKSLLTLLAARPQQDTRQRKMDTLKSLTQERQQRLYHLLVLEPQLQLIYVTTTLAMLPLQSFARCWWAAARVMAALRVSAISILAMASALPLPLSGLGL